MTRLGLVVRFVVRLAVPLASAAALAVVPAHAERRPVLEQIDVPHPYYYREMYLPQLTTGPSAVAFSPDGSDVVYSMAGSLWRQAVDSGVAEELTAGPGYDYQPDWAPDGRRVVFARYDHDAVELWLLDLATREERPLTSGGAVNVEPRISPDGARIAYVSTALNRRFHVFVATLRDGRIVDARPLVGERPSSVARYYYSPFDHEISPTWSPDGQELIFVGNRGHRYGSGGLWRIRAEPGAEPREIRDEETTWKARPDWGPDGRRVVYSSYLGGAWHQLWGMTAGGGDVFPLTYGAFDVTAPRWSRDGRRIAFVSNRDGDTSLWIHEVLGGAERRLDVRERRFKRRMARLALSVVDASGAVVPARIAVTGADGRAYAPESAWMHADDGFDRAERPFEAHYFHAGRGVEVVVPAGEVSVEVLRGFESRVARDRATLAPGERRALRLRLRALDLPKGWADRWTSGDLHVHMNYGGAYRNAPRRLVQQAEAEDLDVVHDLIVNKEQRVPDVELFTGAPDPASTPRVTLVHGQEFHSSYWGHLGLLRLTSHLLIPDYAAYDNTFAASLYPTNTAVADLAHQQDGLVGYVHPFDAPPDPADEATRLTYALPVDAALGKVDYYEVVGFSDHRASADVWYRLLNLGFRIPAGAGTDAMANFASLRGPVGLNRVYVDSGGSREIGAWVAALKKGRTLATNGPLLGFTLDFQEPGGELGMPSGGGEMAYSAWLRSIVPVDKVQVVCNGAVVQDIPLADGGTRADVKGTIRLDRSGWCLLRAFAQHAVHPVLDLYPYATTSPVYVTVAGRPPASPADAAYFLAWLDRIIAEAAAHAGYNTPAEKEETLRPLQAARAVYAAAAARGN